MECNMTCYFRHKQMKSIFKKVGVEITKENKKEIDKLIHSIVGVEYKNCSATWKADENFPPGVDHIAFKIENLFDPYKKLRILLILFQSFFILVGFIF